MTEGETAGIHAVAMPDYLIAWLHLTAAATLVGGLIFSRCVLTQAFRRARLDPNVQHVRRLSGRRFRTIVWISLVTLTLTGASQLLDESGSARIETAWGAVLMLKLFLFGIAFALLLVHDFILDPHGPASETPPSFPSRADRLETVILLITLATLLVAAYLGTV